MKSLKSDKKKLVLIRSSRPDVFCKKVFLEISQNSKENTCARVSIKIGKKTILSYNSNGSNEEKKLYQKLEYYKFKIPLKKFG